MACELCPEAAKRAVGRLASIGSVDADLAAGTVRAVAKPGRSVDVAAVSKRLAGLGFQPEPEATIRAAGLVQTGVRGRLVFRVPGHSEVWDLLEGAELRRLLQALRKTRPDARVLLTGRLHRHPGRLPPSLSVLSYEVKQP
jgi:copper chaperone CopZ